MKTNTLKVLATCLSILIPFIFLGCTGRKMIEPVDNGMGVVMEKPMDTMQEKSMKNDTEMMKKQKMEEPMNEMKSDGAKDDMGATKGNTMNTEKETM